MDCFGFPLFNGIIRVMLVCIICFLFPGGGKKKAAKKNALRLEKIVEKLRDARCEE